MLLFQFELLLPQSAEAAVEVARIVAAAIVSKAFI
jgi:hypothetical protein